MTDFNKLLTESNSAAEKPDGEWEENKLYKGVITLVSNDSNQEKTKKTLNITVEVISEDLKGWTISDRYYIDDNDSEKAQKFGITRLIKLFNGLNIDHKDKFATKGQMVLFAEENLLNREVAFTIKKTVSKTDATKKFTNLQYSWPQPVIAGVTLKQVTPQ